MSKYRELTPSEIQTVAKELTVYAVWSDYIGFIAKYYGPKAVSVKAYSDFESNDEGGSYARLDSLEVFDAEGNALEPDITLPAWSEVELKKTVRYWYSGCVVPTTVDEAQDMLSYVWDCLDAPEAGSDEYSVNDPPKMTFGKVYVEDSATQAYVEIAKQADL